MAGKTAVGWARPEEIRVYSGPPQLAVRLVSALLALAVAGVHVADQGSITAFNAPPEWLGWAYRLIEVGGVLTAMMLLLPRSRWLGWAAGVLLGAGPLLGYLARITGCSSTDRRISAWSRQAWRPAHMGS